MNCNGSNMEAETVNDRIEDLQARSYQAQLEEIAIQKNTIIHLPTGSGKTFIAIRLINRFRNVLKLPWGKGGKRTFFLVNTVPLVIQQKQVLSKLCAVESVSGYTGEDGVDYWDKSKWDAELSNHQVIVMTSQILADMLTHCYIKIDDINLLIFDECHHAVVDHPMRLVMKHFENYPVQAQPRVLGLTATLLNSNVAIGKVEESLRELETTFHATIATVDELGQVLRYSTNPHEIIKYFNSPRLTPAASKAIEMLKELQNIVMQCKTPVIKSDVKLILERGQREICSDPKKFIKEIKNLVTSMISFLEELGAYGGALGIVASIIIMERLKRRYNLIEEENILKLSITHSNMARMVLLNSMTEEDEYKKILNNSSEKILLLLNILKEYNPKYFTSPGVLLTVNITKKPLSGIIFTQTRFAAKVLYNLLKAVKEANPTDFGFLNHEFIVGFNINPFKCTREQYYTKKSSQKALLAFRNKETNCLIATNVIEEGVDIQQCLLVLRYDPPKEYRSYIQSKGRARSSESSFVMLVDAENKNKFMQLYHSFQSTEDYIQRILMGHTDYRNAPTLDDIDEGLYNEDEIPPYITPHGSRLSSVQAISLLHRYCSQLPHDQFTTITPLWIEETTESPKLGILKQVKLYMPLACPIKDIIEGPPLPSLKGAKRAAALNACIRLHQEGELDPITLLPRQYITVDFAHTDIKKCFPNWPWDEKVEDADIPKPGTKRRTRKYPKVFPKHLKGPENWTSGEQNFYLHIIKLKINFKEPVDSREKALYELLKRDEGFGLLTVNSLPKLCDFPMFLSIGEVTTSIEMNFAVIALTPQLFELVKSFHYFLFDQVLDVGKKFVVFDGTENSIYVLPVKSVYGDYDIDWNVIQKHTAVEPVVEPSSEEKKSLHVTEETYKYHVVTPWYRYVHHPYRYIVSNVLEYMTPKSRFESTGDRTFAGYYSCKYNLNIEGDQNQPLLEARNINTRMNCLVPRALTIRSFTEKQKKEISSVQGDSKPKGFQEILIPEFCIKHEFPGVFWFKALILPSILHRVFVLLVAYELRYEIAKHTKVGQAQLKPGQEWLPIEVDYQTAIQSLLSLIEDPKPVPSLDRVNHPLDEHVPHQPPKVLSMMDSLIKLQKKKISEPYDWDERAEPIDIERNIATVTVMDIECYEAFVSVPMNEEKKKESSGESIRSPPRPAPAILPSPVKLVTKIAILSKKPSVRGPELRDILAAITTIGSCETANLERVETLGDCFLKFASTVYLFYKFPKFNEGQLTNIRCRLVGNRNLYYAGAKAQLGGLMKAECFIPSKDFLIPGFFAPKEVQDIIEEKQIRPTCLIKLEFSPEEALSGQLSDESQAMIKELFSGEIEGTIEPEPVEGAQMAMQGYVRAQAVSDKTVADCVEALLGTYLVSDGITAAVKVMEWFKLIPAKENFTQYLTKSMPTILSEKMTTEEEVDRIMNHCRDDVEKLLNYKFKDPSFLLQAITHHSYMRNRLTGSYERLEFLGDAILDFLITSHIFETCPNMKPGDLTDLKSALVNNVTFASYIVKKGLHKYLCYDLNPALESAIIAFIEHQELNNHAIVEQVLYLIDEEDCQIAEYTEVPKILSDLFESLAGAIYLDSRGDLEAVWNVFYPIMSREIHEFSRCIPKQPVRVLYEQVYACPIFGDVLIPNTNVLKVLVPVTVTKNGKECTVYGLGHNKFQAKRAAAKIALKVLGM